ncbi:MAG: hypothetical protein AAFX94_17370 [Myxococcota bacterium]
MTIQCFYTRLSPKEHRFQVERPPHPPIDIRLETRSMLLHDFCHHAVESELETPAGFFGLLAAGWSLEALRHDALSEEIRDPLMEIERHVVMLQTHFKQGPTDLLGSKTLRATWGAWNAAKTGQRLVLTWPGSEPVVQTIER